MMLSVSQGYYSTPNGRTVKSRTGKDLDARCHGILALLPRNLPWETEENHSSARNTKLMNTLRVQNAEVLISKHYFPIQHHLTNLYNGDLVFSVWWELNFQRHYYRINILKG
jgi:hypothetical protein